MAMNRGLYVPINTTGNVGTTELEARLALSALFEHNAAGVPRSGLLIPAGSSQTTVVTGNGNMSYTLAAVHPVINTAANDGVYSFTSTGTTSVNTTDAPATNSRIDLLWVKQNDKSKGDANNLAVFGVTQGAAASSPVAPALPARAMEVARATILSTTTATNTAAITQTFTHAALRGTPIPVRNTTERATITAPYAGQKVRRMDLLPGSVDTYSGSAWTISDIPTASASLDHLFAPVTSGGWDGVKYGLRGGIAWAGGAVTRGNPWGADQDLSQLPAAMAPGFRVQGTGIQVSPTGMLVLPAGSAAASFSASWLVG